MLSSALAWAKHVLPAVEFKHPNVKIRVEYHGPTTYGQLSMCVCSSRAKGSSGHGEHAACLPEA